MKHLAAAAANGAPENPHQQLALQQSAMHCVQLAVARWRTGYAAFEAAPPSDQARWYAEAHGRFTDWLRAGGFAQDAADGEAAAPYDTVYSETALQAEAAAERVADAAAAERFSWHSRSAPTSRMKPACK
jgi:hypothetical protein